MADTNPPLPSTPIRLTVSSKPTSVASSLTPLSSMSSGKSSSGESQESLSAGNSLAPPNSRAVRRVRSNVKPIQPFFTQLLTPEKALPGRMKLVGDTFGTAPSRKRKRRSSTKSNSSVADDDDNSSEQEALNLDFDVGPEWSPEEHDALMLCLREEGLIKCMDKYLIEKDVPLRRMLKAFGKEEKRPATDEELALKLQIVMRQALRNRVRLDNYSTITDAVNLIFRAKKIMVLTGAGISVSCGIPDFRSSTGIYARIKESGKYEDLEDPQDMFSIEQFEKRPSMFYSFIGQLWPEDIEPSPAHQFLKCLEDEKKLLRVYTQNIDGIEQTAGVSDEKVFHCHGSFKTASCMDCHNKVPGSQIRPDILAGKVPQCGSCIAKAETARLEALKNPPRVPHKRAKRKRASKAWESDEREDTPQEERLPGVMKPDITFFGEKLHGFEEMLYKDREDVDLLIVMGTSLKVKPVSEVLAHIPHTIPQILINKTPVEHANPDLVLLGDCQDIVQHLLHELGWVLPSQLGIERGQSRRKRTSELSAKRLGQSHVWMFDGASVPAAWARKHDPNYVPVRKKRARKS